MKLKLIKKWVFVACTLAWGCTHPVSAQEDALRKFFAENSRLVLVNPFPSSLPMGIIFRPEQGELREIDRDCFLPYQSQIVPQEQYDFITKNTTKKRQISADLLKHLGNIDVAGSEKVSIDVLEGQRSLMPESRFRKIVESHDFTAECSQLLLDKRNSIVYEIVTGRLAFTFWKRRGGKWQVNSLPIVTGAPEKRVEGQDEAGESNKDEAMSPLALWTSTTQGEFR